MCVIGFLFGCSIAYNEQRRISAKNTFEINRLQITTGWSRVSRTHEWSNTYLFMLRAGLTLDGSTSCTHNTSEAVLISMLNRLSTDCNLDFGVNSFVGHRMVHISKARNILYIRDSTSEYICKASENHIEHISW